MKGERGPEQDIHQSDAEKTQFADFPSKQRRSIGKNQSSRGKKRKKSIRNCGLKDKIPQLDQRNEGKIYRKHVFNREKDGEIPEENLQNQLKYMLEEGENEEKADWIGLVEPEGREGEELPSGTKLEAVTYGAAVLNRMGYGYSVIAYYLIQPIPLISSLLSQFHASPYHGFSFDLSLSLLRKEILTISRFSDISYIPPTTSRLIIQRNGLRSAFIQALQRANITLEASEKAGWLYERGLNLLAISRIHDFPVETAFSATVGL